MGKQKIWKNLDLDGGTLKSVTSLKSTHSGLKDKSIVLVILFVNQYNYVQEWKDYILLTGTIIWRYTVINYKKQSTNIIKMISYIVY